MSRADPAMVGTSWRPALADPESARAIAIATEVLRRATDEALLREAAEAAPAQSQYPGNAAWRPATLAQGNAGVAVAANALHGARPGEGWDAAAHRHLRIAAMHGAVRSLPTGLFTGIAGLHFAASTISPEGYERLRASAIAALEPAVLEKAREVAAAPTGREFSDTDVVSGLAGVAATFLRHEEGREPVTAALLRALVASAALAESGEPVLATIQRADAGPEINLGVAHGVPGLLAILSLLALDGRHADAATPPLAPLVEWLVGVRSEDEHGPDWPGLIPVGVTPRVRPAVRPAWCYGSAGIARALWLAGSALDDAGLRALAVEALEATHRRFRLAAAPAEPGLCHGLSGLLQITLRFSHDTGLESLRASAARLAGVLMDAFDPDAAMGFRIVEPGGVRVDQAGLLNGAVGAALSLLAASTPVEPQWDRMLLLA